MTETTDIRWHQRFENYKKALCKLQQGVDELSHETAAHESLLQLMEEGIVKRFEYTHELAWNVMKDYEAYQGYTDVRGSRDALRKALAIGLVDSPKWMDSIADRNLTAHTYDEETASSVLHAIKFDYLPLFTKFRDTMERLKAEEEY